MSTATAKLKTVRIAPRKARLVADLIRGKKVQEAINLLSYTNKASAPVVLKLLESAVANAENAAAEMRERIDTDEMTVSAVMVDPGPTIKRFRAAARGRAVPIRKRTCHIKLEISDQ